MLSSHQKIKGISKRDTLADGAIHKTTLTKINHPSILCPPRNIEVGRGNLFSKGDCTPIIKSVFLYLSFKLFKKSTILESCIKVFAEQQTLKNPR